jgi:predicted kinase
MGRIYQIGYYTCYQIPQQPLLNTSWYTPTIMHNTIKKPTVYMICGFIGAGKTTFARMLEKETGAVRVTKDEWMVQIFGNTPPKDNFAEYDSKVTKLAQDLAYRLVQAGVDVILDEGFWEKSYRNEVRKKIHAVGGEPMLYYVRQPIELMRKRTIERSKSPPSDSFVITEAEFNEYLKQWEPPEEGEGYVLAE